MKPEDRDMHIKKALLIFVVTLVSVVATKVDGQELISNGTFDANLDGWMVHTYSTGTMEWSATQGLPPGALRLVGEDQFAMTTACLHFAPGSFIMTADGFMETRGENVHCGLNFAMYSMSADCTGEFSSIAIVYGTDIVPSVQRQNEWEPLVMVVPIPDDVSETGILSFRPIVVKAGDFGGDDACIFDNVSLRLAPRSTIPTVSKTGLVVLEAFLAIIGLVVLRSWARFP